MRLFLCSSGFTTKDLAKQFLELIDKPSDEISFAVIPNAMGVQPGPKDWFIDEINKIIENFSSNIDFVDLEALSQEIWLERLEAVDVIYFTGGENEPLFTTLQNSGYVNQISHFLSTKVIMGTSAGAMVHGQRLTPEAFDYMYGPVGTIDNYGITDYLNLFEGCFIAHLDAPHFPKRDRDLIKKVADRTDQPIYALDETSALIIKDDQIKTFGNIYQPNL